MNGDEESRKKNPESGKSRENVPVSAGPMDRGHGEPHITPAREDHEAVSYESDGEPVSFWSRVSQWRRLASWAALGTACVWLLLNANDIIDLVDKGWGMFHSDETQIQQVVIDHYEAIEDHDYKRAYSYLSTVGKRSAGSLSEFAGIREKCRVQKADVHGKPQVSNLGDDGAADATVDVSFVDKCATTEFVLVWNVVKVDGEWKLVDQKKNQPGQVASSTPVEFENGGSTKSAVGGDTDQAHLEVVKSSATLESQDDRCGESHTYGPQNVVDGRNETAWLVARRGDEQWLLLEYSEPVKVSRIGIIPGYDKVDPCANDLNRFYEMRVVREAEIGFSNGTSKLVSFKREPEMQIKNVPDTETTSLRITVVDTFPPGNNPDGSSYDWVFDRVGISEVRVR